MNNPLSLIFPIINVLVTGLFAGVVIRQYLQRHRPYQLYWGIALLMAFGGTLAYVLMIGVSPTSSAGIFFFRLYYMLGAALMPAWLGLGSVALVTDRRFTRVMLMILLTLSIFAVVFISQAVVDIHALSQIVGSAGAGVFRPAEWLGTIIILNTLGVVEVVGVAIYSGWQVLRRQSSPHLLWANILILAGDLINAAAGSSARLGLGLAFWLVMAIGWSIFFIGVVLAGKRRSLPTSTKTTPADVQPVEGRQRETIATVPVTVESRVETRVETEQVDGIEKRIETRIEHKVEMRIEHGIETRIETRTEARIETKVSTRVLDTVQSR